MDQEEEKRRHKKTERSMHEIRQVDSEDEASSEDSLPTPEDREVEGVFFPSANFSSPQIDDDDDDDREYVMVPPNRRLPSIGKSPLLGEHNPSSKERSFRFTDKAFDLDD